MNETVEKKSKWGKVGKVALIFFVILACIAGVAYSFTDLGRAGGQYQSNRNLANQLGLPFSAADMDRLRTVPDADNAAILISEPLNRVTEMRSKYDYKTPFEEYAQKCWPKIEGDYPLFEKASHRKALIFKRDMRDPNGISMLEFPNFKFWIKVVMVQVRQAADKNERETAMRHLATAARLAMLIDKDQFVFATELRLAAVSMVQLELKRWVNEHGHDREWRQRVRDIISIIDKPYDLRPAIRSNHWLSLFPAEVILGLKPDTRPMEDRNLNYDVFPNFESLMEESQRLRFIPRYQEANLSRVHEYYVRALQEYPKKTTDYAALDHWSKDLISFRNTEALSFKVAWYVIPLFLLDGTTIQKEFVRSSVILQAAAMLEMQRRPIKGLPIAGQRSLDIDGKPLRLKQTTKDWILYSIGSNKVDDGGDDDPKHPKDFVVHLPKGDR